MTQRYLKLSYHVSYPMHLQTLWPAIVFHAEITFGKYTSTSLIHDLIILLIKNNNVADEYGSFVNRIDQKNIIVLFELS